jgi:hypothetical protein
MWRTFGYGATVTDVKVIRDKVTGEFTGKPAVHKKKHVSTQHAPLLFVHSELMRLLWVDVWC